MLIRTKGFLPLVLAIHDYWGRQRRKVESGSLSIEPVPRSLLRRVFSEEWRYLWPAAALSITYILIASLPAFPRSTSICPISNLSRLTTPFNQLFGLSLDCTILILLSYILSSFKHESSASASSPLVFLGFILVVSLPRLCIDECCVKASRVDQVSSTLIGSAGIAVYITHPGQWREALIPSSAYLASLAFWALMSMLTIPCALKIVSLIPE